MAVYWKFKDGFAVRYGGFKDVQWFVDFTAEEYINYDSLPAEHPTQIAIQGEKLARPYLRWWNEQQSHIEFLQQLTAGHFRPLAEILSQFCEEITQTCELRSDTVFYLRKEFHSLLEKINRQIPVIIPPSALLHLMRLTECLSYINHCLHDLTRRSYQRDYDAIHRIMTAQVVHERDKIEEPMMKFQYIPAARLKSAAPDKVSDYLALMNRLLTNVYESTVDYSLPNKVSLQLFSIEKLNYFVEEARGQRRQDVEELKTLFFELENLHLNLLRGQSCHPTIEEFRKLALEQQLVDSCPIVLQGGAAQFEALFYRSRRMNNDGGGDEGSSAA